MIEQFLNQAGQGQQSQGGGQPGAGGFSLDQMLTGHGGLLTGAAAGGLAAMLMGGAKPKKLAKNALKVGGVALVGGLAYKAYRDWQSKKGAAPAQTPARPVQESAFLPAQPAAQDSLARKIARAMITAAKADGHVTPEETQRIGAQLDAASLSPADRAFLDQELGKPMDIEAVVRDANTPEIAAELYAASILAVDPDGPSESAYLSLLAARLDLDPELESALRDNARRVQA